MMKTNLVSALAAVALTATALVAAPAAAEPQFLGTFKDWSAYAYDENGGKVCFMMSKPKKSEGKYKKRGDVYIQITHRTADKSFDVVSFAAGYAYPSNSEALVRIGNQTYKMFTDGEMAWAPDEAADRTLVDAIRGGSALAIEGESARGTKTKDTYSLSGTSAAYQAINQACNVQR